MRRRTPIIITILGLFSGLLGTGSALLAEEAKKETIKEPSQAALPDPVAVVNNTPISRALFEVYAQQRQRSGVNASENRKMLADELVVQELLVEEAKKQNLEKDPQFIQQMDLLKRNLLASTAVHKVLSEHPVSEEAIEKEYETTKASLAKEEYKARHILVDSEDKAKEIIKELKEGADFSELAKTQSSDSSGASGGDLGWFTTDMMVEPFGEAVAKLKKGQFTEEPVKTQFGWHVILLDDVRDATPPSLEEMRPQISQQLQGQMLNEYLQKLRAGAKIDVKVK
jgi:peptidyl-prolyl cis-trans isomerase C